MITNLIGLCVCLFYVLYFSPVEGVGRRLLSSACKSDQVDFTDRMSFLPSHLMEEISANTEAFNAKS